MRRDPRVTLTIVDPADLLQLCRVARSRRVRGGPDRERHDRCPCEEVHRPGHVSVGAAGRRARQLPHGRRARARNVMSDRPLRIGRARCAAALHVPADARRLAPGRGGRRRHALHLGSLLPALRRSRRRALRVLEPARGDRGGHGAHPLRRPRELQLVSQPEPARRHGAHRRPHLGRSPDPRPRFGLVRARLPRVRLRVRHGDHAPERVPPGAAGDPRAPGEAQSAAACAGTSRC